MAILVTPTHPKDKPHQNSRLRRCSEEPGLTWPLGSGRGHFAFVGRFTKEHDDRPPTGIADGDGELELRRGVFHHVRENNNNDCNCFDPSSVNGPETRAGQPQQRVELFLKLLGFFSLIFIFKLFRTREEKRLGNPTD